MTQIIFIRDVFEQFYQKLIFHYLLVMRTIAIFNDSSAEARNAAEFALNIAQKIKADILVLNVAKHEQPEASKKLVLTADPSAETGTGVVTLIKYLSSQIADDDFKPVIWDIDASNYSDKEVCELIIQKNIWLMVKGIETHVTHALLCHIDVQSVLNHVGCPLLLIPDNYKKRNFENIAYAVDMRYCRRAVLKYLSEFARAYHAKLTLEHVSAKGLPPLDDKYALSLFHHEIAGLTQYDKIYFNNIKENGLNKAIGVIINNLHTDLLALVNHRFHFEEIFGRAIKNCMPDYIPVPVIVFPL